MVAHKYALRLESQLEELVNMLQPGTGIAEAYDKLISAKQTRTWLADKLDEYKRMD
jgi:hypothetical protein